MRRLSRNLRGIPVGESAKARPRRTREGVLDAYRRGRGLDIGFGDDWLARNCDGWDKQHGDAQYLRGVSDHVYAFVYSSHTLEHSRCEKMDRSAIDDR